MTLDDDVLLFVFYVAIILGATASLGTDKADFVNYGAALEEARKALEAWRNSKGVRG